jgi:hypothetical protein
MIVDSQIHLWAPETPERPRQYVTPFTEELDFLSDADRRWVTGDALLEFLGWR